MAISKMKLVNILADNEYLNDVLLKFVELDYFHPEPASKFVDSVHAVSYTHLCNYVQMRIETLSYLLISPVFFASIGLKVVLPEMSTSIMIFSVLLLVLAILTKIVGCGLGAKLCRYENIQSLRIGIGMVSRGEVALIVASKGIKVGLMNEAFFGPIIIMVVLTTVITPILLKIVFKDRENDPDVYASSELIEDYEKIEQNEKLAQKVLEQS